MSQSNGLDRAFERAAHKRALQATLGKLRSDDERRDMLAELLGELPEADSSPVVRQVSLPAKRTQKKRVARRVLRLRQPTAGGKNLSERALELMRSTGGISVEKLGEELYPSNEPASQKHNARAVLRWLHVKGRVRESKGGLWIAIGTPKAAADSKPAVLSEMIVDVVSALGRPVGSGDILIELQKSVPKIDPTKVYKTIFRVYRAGKLHRAKRAGRPIYSIPGGGNQ